MAKATLTLSDGTLVQIDGSPEEIQKIISLHQPAQPLKEIIKRKKILKKTPLDKIEPNDSLDIQKLINSAKSSDEYENIEKHILDRTSIVDRILLPLYLAHTYVSEQTKLTSGDITKFLSQLGVNIAQSNVAKHLSSTALKYVMGDKIRKQGQAVGYRLSRKGVQYISSVIQGETK